MNGYVKNKSHTWAHAMKRAIRPGEKIPLDELYAQYGKKHDLADGEEFVSWLRSVKLRNDELWEVVIHGEGVVEEEEEPQVQEEDKDPYEGVDTEAPIKEMTVRDVALMSVRRAREVLPKVMDLNLLKYALQEANQLAGKDTLCRMLRKRIQELQISR